MKLDKTLVTGIVLGIVAGLSFSPHLAPFKEFLVIGAVVLLMRYVRVI